MDDLEFRRSLYADPSSQDPALKQAMADDPTKLEFCKELKQLDKKIQQACEVDVPSDLVHKLMLRQTMQTHAADKKRNRIQLALAASLAFVFGVSFTLWQHSNLINLSEQAIAHVYYEGDYALGATGDISLAQVNAKLARFGGEFIQEIGQIQYANFCDFENIRSLHIVVNGEFGKMTVFIIPQNDGLDPEGFSQGRGYDSQATDLQQASMIVVGEEGTDVAKAKQTLSKSLRFSA